MRTELRQLVCAAVTISLLGHFALAQEVPQHAQEGVAPAGQTALSAEELAQFADEVYLITTYRDNVFLYEEVAAELDQTARSMVGSVIEVPVRVDRVRCDEVWINVLDPGKARIVLRHSSVPMYGNLHTRYYRGSAATQRANLMSQLPSLRIGIDVSQEVARGLRKGHMMTVRGTIESVIVKHRKVFKPDTLVIVGDWTVEQVQPAEQYLPL